MHNLLATPEMHNATASYQLQHNVKYLWRLQMFICQDDKGGQALHLLADQVLQQAYVHPRSYIVICRLALSMSIVGWLCGAFAGFVCKVNCSQK